MTIGPAEVLVAARAVHFAATLAVVGAVVFHVCVPQAAFASMRQEAVKGMARFLSQYFWTGMAAAVLSGAVWFAALALRIGGDAPFAETSLTLLTQTQFGAVCEIRFVLCVLLGTLVFFAGFEGIQAPLYREGAVVLLAISFAGTLAWAGHSGAGDGLSGVFQTGADALHLVAASVWLGALVPLAVLLLMARAAGTANAAYEATRRFSRLGLLSVAALLVTGLVNAWFLVGSITALTVSDYGRLLMVKVALFVVMLCFAAVNRLYLTPRLADRNSNASAALARNSLAEAALGLIVIIVVAVLGTLAPAHEELHLHHVDAAHRAQSPPPPQQRSIVYRSECGESSCPRDERCS